MLIPANALHTVLNVRSMEIWVQNRNINMAGRFSEEGLAKIRRGRLKRYIDAVNKKHGSKIKIIEKSFTEQRKEVEFICSIHGHSSLKAETLLSSKYGCKKCALFERDLTREKQQDKKIKNILSTFYKNKYILVDKWKGSKSRNNILQKTKIV